MDDEVDTARGATDRTPQVIKMYPWEARHEWIARISFIEDHTPTYGFERALSLSMVWANMKFLGCRYPTATEQLVMNYNVPETDKGRKFPKNGVYVLNTEDFPDGVPLGALSVVADEESHLLADEEDNDSDTSTQVSMLISDIREKVETDKKQGDVKPATTPVSPELSDICYKLSLPDDLNQQDHPVSVLDASCQKANLTISYAFKEHVDETTKRPTVIGYQATVLINDVIVGKGDSYSAKKDAKKHACEVVIERVKDIQKSTGCAPAPNQSEHIEKSEIMQTGGVGDQAAMSTDGIGGKLLQKMGWDKDSTSTSQASQVFDSYGNLGRSGLGFAPQESSALRQNVEQKLYEFVNSDKDELVFSSEFSLDERKLIHSLCAKYKLSHKSHGKGDERKLVIQKKANAQTDSETANQKSYGQHYEFHHSYDQQSNPSSQYGRQDGGRSAMQSSFFQPAVNKADSSRSHPYQGYRQHHSHQIWEGKRY
ncbi:uncharacterized protein [Dysidea avara]|uniref:uncharacterized protein n=1 Tax=Dysidea avara TaxID=196820 RepID=UPI00332F9184